MTLAATRLVAQPFEVTLTIVSDLVLACARVRRANGPLRVHALHRPERRRDVHQLDVLHAGARSNRPAGDRNFNIGHYYALQLSPWGLHSLGVSPGYGRVREHLRGANRRGAQRRSGFQSGNAGDFGRGKVRRRLNKPRGDRIAGALPPPICN